MRNLAWVLAGICWMMLMAGCGNELGQSPEQNNSNLSMNDSIQEQTEDESSRDRGDTEHFTETTKDEEEQQNEDQMDEEALIEKAYYMTSAYRFKPIDPEGETKVALLTFDDGPKDEVLIDRMLEILDAHQAKAIFFLNGYRIEANPELAIKLFEHGHSLGNHSWDHINLSKENEKEIDQQIESVQAKIQELTGEVPVFFRPPHAAGNDYIRQKVEEEGMLYMTWSNGSRDWEKDYQTPEAVISSVMEQLHPGSNILMHELPWTVEALDDLLTSIEEAGYSFLHPQAIDIHYDPLTDRSNGDSK